MEICRSCCFAPVRADRFRGEGGAGVRAIRIVGVASAAPQRKAQS